MIEDCPFVFSTNGLRPVSGWSKTKARPDGAMLALAKKEITPWMLHDLRRTAVTGMANLGIEPHVVEAVVNHISGAKAGVAGIYNRAEYAARKGGSAGALGAARAGHRGGGAANVGDAAKEAGMNTGAPRLFRLPPNASRRLQHEWDEQMQFWLKNQLNEEVNRDLLRAKPTTWEDLCIMRARAGIQVALYALSAIRRLHFFS